ncbi:MAG: hypothetical protein LUQ65_02115 [Candidatus Helarchaeota archaeon]|nr:hypothetical protein [Candidatus Helarchaeota archaeon]
MAKRLTERHLDETRLKIRISALINRIQKYALGELTDEDISPNRLNAIKLLLAKTLPDLQSIEHTGKDGTNLIPKSDDPEIARRIAFILTQQSRKKP